jgi:hypothetical protein
MIPSEKMSAGGSIPALLIAWINAALSFMTAAFLKILDQGFAAIHKA